MSGEAANHLDRGHIDEGEEEELEDLPSIPDPNNGPESVSGGGGSGSENDEELLSLTNSPEEMEDDEGPNNTNQEEEEEELPSITNSPQGDNNERQNDPQPGSSRQMREEQRASASSSNEEKQHGSIRGFRTRTDENGEIVFEFVSDEEDDTEEAAPVGPVPTGSLPPGRIMGDSDSEGSDTNAIAERGFGLVGDSDDESDDEEYVPGRYVPDVPDMQFEGYLASLGPALLGATVADRVRRGNRRSSGHRLGTAAEDAAAQEEAQALAARNRTRRGRPTQRAGQGQGQAQVEGQRRPRRRRKRATTVKKPKRKVPRAVKPPKPLAPKIHTEKLFANDESEVLADGLFGYGSCKLKLHLSPSDENSVLRVQKINLRIIFNNEWFAQGENGTDWTEKFPGLNQVNLYVNRFKDFAVIEVETEKTLTDEEAETRPKPKLNAKDKRRKLIFIQKKRFLFPCQIEGFNKELFFGFSQKIFQLHITSVEGESKRIELEIVMDRNFIVGSHKISEIPAKQPQPFRDILNKVFNVTPPPDKIEQSAEETETDEENDRKEDIPWFYGQIKKYHEKELLPEPNFSLQPEKVVPFLRPYQRQAVQWMLYREGVVTCEHETRVNLQQAFLNKMYVPVDLDGTSLYYNPYIGYVSSSLPTPGDIPSGGILADEMGLGKTVEAICLIMLNPRRDVEELNKVDSEIVSSSDEDGSVKGFPSDEIKIEGSSEDEEEWETDESDSDYEAEKRKALTNKTVTHPKGPRVVDSEPVRKSTRLSSKTEHGTESVGFVHPRLRRKRNVSPCTFSTDAESFTKKQLSSVDEKPITCNLDIPSGSHNTVPKSPEKNAEEIEAVPSTSTSSHTQNKEGKELPKSSKRKRPIISEDSEKTSPKKTKKGKDSSSTYERLKAIYEAELGLLSEAKNVERVRFHGTFFETKIARQARFECICGGHEDPRKKIVSCANCHSSQHADCVGFSKELQTRYVRLGIDYTCPHCEAVGNPYPAKTTLIVTPESISHQWINELRRHVMKNALSILFYKGVSQHGYIPPMKVAEYDIVLTTYTTLAAEVNYLDLPHLNDENARPFRHAKRFMTIPSPLPSVQWHRCILDEAQMVESFASRMSIMARRLPAIHRWCVTGTPINHGLQDLFGLFAFLGVEPVGQDFWWERLVQIPFHRKDVSLLYELFGQMIWRMGKNDVLDQLGIPAQTSVVRWLKFSAVEHHFYKQQYETCSKNILDKISRLRQSNKDILQCRLSALDRQTLKNLLQPFLELRKACCHPQVVKGQTISLQKGTMTMEELLAQLIKKTSIQCADDHRQIVASLNGTAGIHIIENEWFEASEKYREVLQSASKNKEYFPTDTLQLLHTMENLADLLDRHHNGIPYTLRDSSLRSEAEELRRKYLEKYAKNLNSAKVAVEVLTQSVDELFGQLICPNVLRSSWWVFTLREASKMGKVDDLIKRCKDDLADVTKHKRTNHISLADQFHDASGLERVMIENILAVEDIRKTVLDGLEELQKEDAAVFVDGAVNCHLRKKSQYYYKQSDEQGFRCVVCRYHDQFVEYESVLFKEEKKQKVVRTGRKWQQTKLVGDVSSDLTEEERNLVLLKEEEELMESLADVQVGLSDQLRRGNWGDSESEKILKILNNFARMNRLPREVRDDGSAHIKAFDAMKKEFRLMRILWRQIYDQISAHDELTQATTRLCLKITVQNVQHNEEPGPSTGSSRRKQRKPRELASTTLAQDQRIQNINLVERHELGIRKAEMQSDLETGKSKLSLHFGQLLYLETLKKNDYGKTGSINSDICPVCHSTLGQEWCVLKCGHSYCEACVKSMCPNVLHNFLCPLCRSASKYAEVSFVDTKGSEEAGTSKGIKKAPKDIKGSHSTKVEAVLEAVLNIMEDYPKEKIIIFSEWNDMLEIISKALNENDVKNCALLQTGKKFHSDLQLFKEREDMQVLLMPLASGAKGLNIIEATHVLLVEPILNLASELQAIGRVHRIGQTKPTYVYRFYVKNTIEEQLYEILKTHDISSDEEGCLTVADLQGLIRQGGNNSGAGPNIVTVE